MNQTSGGAFLLHCPTRIFAREQFSPEHRAVEAATAEFWKGEVVDHLDAIQAQQFEVLLKVLRKSGELGLLSALIPERYGGMEMDLLASLIITEGVGADGSYSMCHGAQSGIGALPILLFGTEPQRQMFLPKLGTGELIPAYCLTEPQSGSDALSVNTRADFDAAGGRYLLNGQKMWITNGGIADLLTVFAKVDGEHFTAFLVERNRPGVSIGAEEKKMGLKGSSTTAVFFDQVAIPRENLLGEVGRGHIVALNILNLGRLNMAASVLGKCKSSLAGAIQYASDRKAFGKSIAEFGLIQQKLGEMATRIFAVESMVHRIAGAIQDRMGTLDWNRGDAGSIMLKAVEEFAAECSLVKVYASEALDYVADEAVQIFGGYGYHQDYAAERAYRDARIFRIFEGTNEINRLVASTMLLKRARKGVLPLADAVKQLDPAPSGDALENARKTALLLFGAAYAAFGGDMEQQQEVVAGITDVMIDLFALQSVQVRAGQSNSEFASVAARSFAASALERIGVVSRSILAACSASPERIEQVRLLTQSSPPQDLYALRRSLAAQLLQSGRYPL